MGLPVGVVGAGVVALWTVVFMVGAFVFVAGGGLCLIFLVAVVGGRSVVLLLVFLVGMGGLSIMCGFLLRTFVTAVGFLVVVVGGAVVVGFLSITNSAIRKKSRETCLIMLKT